MRIEDVSPRDDGTTTFRLSRDYQSVSGKALCCALSADGTRAYLGGHSGVWRSGDGGATWWHPERPQPPAGSTAVPGALLVPTIHDLLISPASNDIVLAAAARDVRAPSQAGIYRSMDGAVTWTRVYQFTRQNGGVTMIGRPSVLAVAPDDPQLMFAAGGIGLARSTNGGLTWADRSPPLQPGEQVWHVVVGRRQGTRRRVYAVGSRIWYSRNSGGTWLTDSHPLPLGAPADGAGNSSRAVGIHPGNSRVIYVMSMMFNPAINNVEGVVWRGRYPPVTSSLPGQWTRLPPLPLDYPSVTDSGGSFVVPHVGPEGQFCLFASDRRTVHCAVGEPAIASDWVRVEDGRCHLDPHGLSLTPDFRRPVPGLPAPSTYGRILLVNDGGANYSTNGARSWSNGRGLSTLGLVNVSVSPRSGGGPAICMGMGDNSGFSSPDGGASWETQDYVGGDNDCCFADPRQPSRLIVFAPRADRHLFVYVKDGDVPDASYGTPDRTNVPYPPSLPEVGPRARQWGSTLVSNFYGVGYRPLVLTPRGEQPLAESDFITIRFTADQALLLRTTRLPAITAASDWVTTATADGPGVKAFQEGPPLPSANVCIVQASGGHAIPTYYVSDQPTGDIPGRGRVWKWSRGMTAWRQVVPRPTSSGPPAPAMAKRFYVDPYRSRRVYVVGPDHVYRSDDGGSTWVVDVSLERAVTENGSLPFDVPDDGNPGQTLIRDMLFDPDRPGARFAVGPAGVFHTLDGARWSHLLLSSASAMRPNNAAYDFVSCPRALYVATSNRGVLRLSPLPPDWDYPIDSVQGAEGLISLLRVHDLGTGYGPHEDFLDAEVIVWLDTEPEKAFGLKLRDDANRPAAQGMLELLRDAFAGNRRIRIDFVRSGCRVGRIIRVIER